MDFTNTIRGQILLALVIGFSTVVCTDACQRITINEGIIDEDKHTVVRLHNSMRKFVALGNTVDQPPASYMFEMKWDDELAEKAQKWASNCLSNKDHDPQVKTSRFTFGQNIATTSTTRIPFTLNDTMPDFTNVILGWFKEVKNYRFSRTKISVTGHYTQLVWAETSLVGCGYAHYVDPSQTFTKVYVCNYGPGGNVFGETPYVVGNPSCNANGLEKSNLWLGLCKPPSINEILSNYIVY